MWVTLLVVNIGAIIKCLVAQENTTTQTPTALLVGVKTLLERSNTQQKKSTIKEAMQNKILTYFIFYA